MKETTISLRELYEMVKASKRFQYYLPYELEPVPFFGENGSTRFCGVLVSRYGMTGLLYDKDKNKRYKIEIYRRELFLELCEKHLKEGTKKTSDPINPTHYNGTETLDRMIAVFGIDAVIIFCEINAFKYRMRAGKKKDNPIEQDILKALWYEGKMEELNRK